jgi:hypothetical protein
MTSEGENKYVSPWIVAGVFGVLAVAGVVMLWPVFSGLQSPPPRPQPPALDEYKTATLCEAAVKDRLKSPASAAFPFGLAAQAKVTGDRTYQIVSHVDSQNGFGAMLRSRFICTVEGRSPDPTQWQVSVVLE